MSGPDSVTSTRGSGLSPEERGQLSYAKMYRYVFDRPNWLVNLLLIFVCMLIPAIGGIIMLGYLGELWIALHRRPQDVYPEFDFNRFVPYLTRGLWGFLVQLMAAALMMSIVAPIYLCGFAGVSLATHGQGAGTAPQSEVAFVMFLAFFAVGIVVFLAALIAMQMLILPLELRSTFTEDLGKTLDFGWVKDFVVRTWKELLLMNLFVLGSSLVVVLIGFLACGVGYIPAVIMAMMAKAHGTYQVYEIYLDRGGIPIPIKDNKSLS